MTGNLLQEKGTAPDVEPGLLARQEDAESLQQPPGSMPGLEVSLGIEKSHPSLQQSCILNSCIIRPAQTLDTSIPSQRPLQGTEA
jgi:hypothetical protein